MAIQRQRQPGRQTDGRRSAPARPAAFALAVGLVALALVASLLGGRVVREMPTLLFIVAILLTAWHGGLWPSLLATALAAVAFNFHFIRPHNMLSFEAGALLRVAVFILVAFVVSSLTAARRGAGEALREAHDALDRRVQERTAELAEANAALAWHAEQQAAVAELGRRALAGGDLAELMQQAAALTAGTLKVDLCHVLERSQDGACMRPAAGVGWHPSIADAQFDASDPGSLAHRMEQAREPLIVADLRAAALPAPEAYLRQHGIVSCAAAPIRSYRPYGALAVYATRPRRFTPEEAHYLQTMANVLATAVDRKDQETAILQERSRMAREIHDTLAQGFTGIVVQLEAAEDALGHEPDAAREHLDRARRLARESLAEARRSVWALRPAALEESSLPDAFARLADQAASGEETRVSFRVRGIPRSLAPEVEDNLLRIGQEALNNALRHARASLIQIELAFRPHSTLLRVRDNGEGFDAEAPRPGPSFGLTGMGERADRIGARLSVSSRPGRPTEIVVEVPEQEGR